jgi:hypothetical protein
MKIRQKDAVVTIAILLALAAPGAALAGEPAHSLDELQRRVPPGTQVIVTDHEGRALVGKYVLADGQGVLINLPGVRNGRRVAADDVATVTRVGDSWARGIVIGTGAALLPSIGFVTTPPADRFTCSYGYCRPFCVSDGCRLATGISMVAVGAAVGALIDRNVTGREVIFDASPRDEPIALSIHPYPVRGGGAVRVALKF